MASSNIAGTLRRSLLIKVISKPAPSREDVASVIELIAGKVIETGEPVFFRNSDSQAPFMQSMAQTTGFEVRSMLTVKLKPTITLGAIQVLNKEMSAGTDGEFTEKELGLLKEVAEYSSTLIHRMVDPKFVPNAEDTARFVSKLTELPLVTKIEEIEVDDKLLEVVGDALIRREGVIPHKR